MRSLAAIASSGNSRMTVKPEVNCRYQAITLTNPAPPRLFTNSNLTLVAWRVANLPESGNNVI